jgi:hypothetical protein
MLARAGQVAHWGALLSHAETVRHIAQGGPRFEGDAMVCRPQ